MKYLILSVALLAACNHAPPSLSPTGSLTWKANQAVVAIGTVQHTAIALNAIQVCEGATVPPTCHALLSDRNTGIVVDATQAALPALKATPAGWKATATAAIEGIAQRLDAAGKTTLAAYLTAARTVLSGL